MTEIENGLRELLLPVLGLDTVSEIQPEQSLVNDLGADSLDFVEIVFLIEKKFGTKIETGELVSGGVKYAEEQLFADGRLTAFGLKIICTNIPNDTTRFRIDMSKVDIFRVITVRDLASIIEKRLAEK